MRAFPAKPNLFVPTFFIAFIVGQFFFTGQGAAISLVDARGKTVVVDKKPQRIASGTLASDEILHDLLKSTNDLSRIIGLSTLVDDKNFSNIAPVEKVISGRLGGEPESLLSLKPDLVLLADYNRPEFIRLLEKAKINTFVFKGAISMNDIASQIEIIGHLIFEEKAMQTYKTQFLSHLEELRKKSLPLLKKKIRVLNFTADGLVFGKNTMFSEIVSLAGGINAAEEAGLSGWTKPSLEKLLLLQPDCLAVPTQEGQGEEIIHFLKTLPGWKDMAAVKTNNLILLPMRPLMAASPYVTGAIEMLQHDLEQRFDKRHDR